MTCERPLATEGWMMGRSAGTRRTGATTDAPPAAGESLRLRNLGPLSREWLRAVGIESPEDLEAVGAVEAWRRVKERFPGRVTIVLLYGLEGALLGLPWNHLPPEVVERLNDAVGRTTPARRRPGTGVRRTA